MKRYICICIVLLFGGVSQAQVKVLPGSSNIFNWIGLRHIGEADYPTQSGSFYWDQTEHTISIVNDIGGTIMQVGQEMWVRVINRNDYTLVNGLPVRAVGATGDKVNVDSAKASSLSTCITTIGLVTNDILPGEEGWVTITGLVHALNTSIADSVGEWVYLGANGGCTCVRPTGGQIVSLGMVTRKHAQQGVITVQVRIQPTIELLSEMYVLSKANRDMIYWNADSSYWQGGFPDTVHYNVNVKGDFKYEFQHAVGSADAITYTPTVTQNVYTKLLPNITWHDADGIVATTDSVKIYSTGDHSVMMSITLSGTNVNDYWRVGIKRNGVLITTAGRFRFRTVTSGVTDTRSYFWYLPHLTANDWLSFWITNETGSRNPTITDFKIEIDKKPEL